MYFFRSRSSVAGSCALSVVMLAGPCFAQAQNAGSSSSGPIDPITGQPMGTVATVAPQQPAPVVTEPPRLRWGHRLQGEIRVSVMEGYTIAVKYGNGAPCSTNPGEIFCHTRAPAMLDFAAGFGVLEWLEIEARFRMGLEPVVGVEVSSSGRGLPMQAGAGIRAYGSESSRFKFAFGVALLADFTNGQSTDLVARLDEGIHYDVERHFGFYLQLGETIQPLRALTLTIDAGFGIQGRFP